MYQLLVKIHLKKQKVFEEIFQHTLRCRQEVLFSIFSLKVIYINVMLHLNCIFQFLSNLGRHYKIGRN